MKNPNRIDPRQLANSSRQSWRPSWASVALACLLAMLVAPSELRGQAAPVNSSGGKLPVEKLAGEGVWLMPILKRAAPRQARPVRVTVWFEDQFLGDGESYRRHAKTYADWKRRDLRTAVVATLKELNDKSFAAAKDALDALESKGVVSNIERHWIVNGFSCDVKSDGLDQLGKAPGVRKIFRSFGRRPVARRQGDVVKPAPKVERQPFSADRYLHPWYTHSLLADRVWKEFAVTGKGTLNVIHDFNFVFSDNFAYNVYHNDAEIPGNGVDDDKNGLIDDCHGYNFQSNSAQLNTGLFSPTARTPELCMDRCVRRLFAAPDVPTRSTSSALLRKGVGRASLAAVVWRPRFSGPSSTMPTRTV